MGEAFGDVVDDGRSFQVLGKQTVSALLLLIGFASWDVRFPWPWLGS